MAEILPFGKIESGRRMRPDGLKGEIVIFPGIRVEYHEDPPAPAGSGRRRRARRGRAAKAASA